MARILFSLVIIGAFLAIASPLLIPVALGAVFAVLFFPWLLWLERRRMPNTLASSLLTLGITLVILVPAAVLIFLGAKAGWTQLRAMKQDPSTVVPGSNVWENIVSTPVIQRSLERVARWFPIDSEELLIAAEDLLQGAALKVADLLGAFFTAIPAITVGLLIMAISIFYFLVDGKRIVQFIRSNSVFTKDETERLIHSFAGMCRSVVLATIASGFAQSLIFGIACVSAGLSSAALIAFLTFLSSFIPLVGAGPVTIGVSAYQIFIGNTGPGIALLIVALFVGIVDNIIRPIVLKGAGNLHPLLAFVAAFGGLQILGFAGVFLGPILAGLSVVTIQNLTRAPNNAPIQPGPPPGVG